MGFLCWWRCSSSANMYRAVEKPWGEAAHARGAFCRPFRYPRIPYYCYDIKRCRVQVQQQCHQPHQYCSAVLRHATMGACHDCLLLPPPLPLPSLPW